MSDCGHPNQPLVVGHLVDNSIGPDGQRAKPAEAPAKGVPHPGLARKQAKRLLDRVDQRPIEFEQVAPGAPRQNDARHRSAGCPALGELPAQIFEAHRFVARELAQAGLERVEGVGIREDLGGLL